MGRHSREWRPIFVKTTATASDTNKNEWDESKRGAEVGFCGGRRYFFGWQLKQLKRVICMRGEGSLPLPFPVKYQLPFFLRDRA
jgi:hypothetical protein